MFQTWFNVGFFTGDVLFVFLYFLQMLPYIKRKKSYQAHQNEHVYFSLFLGFFLFGTFFDVLASISDNHYMQALPLSLLLLVCLVSLFRFRLENQIEKINFQKRIFNIKDIIDTDSFPPPILQLRQEATMLIEKYNELPLNHQNEVTSLTFDTFNGLEKKILQWFKEENEKDRAPDDTEQIASFHQLVSKIRN